MIVAQLVESYIPIQEVHSSNPVFDKFMLLSTTELNPYGKEEAKEKRGLEWHIS